MIFIASREAARLVGARSAARPGGYLHLQDHFK